MIFSIFKKIFFSYVWRICLTIALLFVVFYKINLDELIQQLKSTNVLTLCFFILIQLLLAYLTSIRWVILTINAPRFQEIKAFFKATMVGLFYNLFMPSSMGGDLVKWTSLTHLKISKTKLIFTMLLDRLMGMMGLIVLGFLGVLIVSLYEIASIPIAVMWLFSVMFFGVIGLFIFILSPIKLKNILFVNKIKPLLKIDDYLTTNKKSFLQSFVLGILIQLIWLISIYYLAISVGFTTNWWQFFCIQPIVSLVSLLPISFAGFGITEVGFMYFFQQIGESDVTIIALTTLLGIFRILMGIIGWIFGIINKNPNFK